MKQIEKSFKKNGYEYKLIARTGMVVLYSMAMDGNVIAYEVHKVRIMPGCKVFNSIVVEHEKLAGNEDFGRYGWSYQHKKNAMTKYKEIGGKLNGNSWKNRRIQGKNTGNDKWRWR